MKIFLSILTILFFNVPAHGSECKRWLTLEKGDYIDIVAPGYGAKDGSVDIATKNIQKFEFQAKIPENFIDPHPLGYSNTSEFRGNHLKSTLERGDSKVVWALRGGRGSSSILPYLKGFKTASPPKLIVGFSDITALHLWANQMGWPSLHAIVLGYNKDANPLVNSMSSIEEIMDILTGKTTEVSYTTIPLNKVAQQSEESFNGSVVGGNLSLIQRSIGTETALDAKGKILFLEDTGEPATRTYEALTHLDRAGVFEGVKVLFLGNFKPSKEEVDKYEIVKKEIGDLMDQRNIPVVFSDNFGHGDYNYPIPFNTSATLRFNSQDEAVLKIKTNS